MILIDRLLASGIRFVFDTIATAANAELDDTESLKRKLMEAQMSLELGEITDEEFVEIETDVFARLRAVREQERAGSDQRMEITGVEVSVDASLDDEPA